MDSGPRIITRRRKTLTGKQVIKPYVQIYSIMHSGPPHSLMVLPDTYVFTHGNTIPEKLSTF